MASTSERLGGSSSSDQVVKWLEGSGLGKYASQFVALGIGGDGFRKLLMQDYEKCGVSKFEDKRKLFQLIKQLNSSDEVRTSMGKNRDSQQETRPAAPPQRPAVAAPAKCTKIIDVLGMDDVELLTDGLDEPIETEPPKAPRLTAPQSAVSSRATSPVRPDRAFMLHSVSVPASPEKFSTNPPPNLASSLPKIPGLDAVAETAPRVSNPARIKVVVRKRPINKKERMRKEHDVIYIDEPRILTVREPKVKVDLTAYEETHKFVFDAVLDETVTNDEVYRETVEPIVPTIFMRTKATCFAYGQTGSGKTFTMQPLPLRAAQDMLNIINLERNKDSNFHLWISFFEIYGGKLFDLLNDRAKLQMREDGRQQVCIVGLKEVDVVSVDTLYELISRGNSARSTGTTGANEESSRSHAILQMVIRQKIQPDKTQARRARRSLGGADNEKDNMGKLVGKFSFIDLAGSERGADTTDNDKQTRMEGAEINKSLLALKECIRALDMEQNHIPFRGSKLTEVLRDSFVGNSRTVMVSCISPGSASVEHTLNTLRYADRVKSLSKGNKKDSGSSSIPTSMVASKSSTTTGRLQQPPPVYFPEPFGDESSSATEKRPRYDNLPRVASASDPGRFSMGGRPSAVEGGSFKEKNASKLVEEIVDDMELDNDSAEVVGTLLADLEEGVSSMYSLCGEVEQSCIPSGSSMEGFDPMQSGKDPKMLGASESTFLSSFAKSSLPTTRPFRSTLGWSAGSTSRGSAEASAASGGRAAAAAGREGNNSRLLRRTSSIPSAPSVADKVSEANQSADELLTGSSSSEDDVRKTAEVPLARRKQPPRKAKADGRLQRQEEPELSESSSELIQGSASDPLALEHKPSPEVAHIISLHEKLVTQYSALEQREMKLLDQIRAGKGSFDVYLLETGRIVADKMSSLAQLQAEIAKFQFTRR
ncbi:hypothetical protein CLOM_g16072 [Closterium sp. NIES-68]|nr:hypothetical protein CLOM_g16072 [Closterium sp. NIES-68]